MFIFFPTGTDAPIYYWPFATGGLILFNIVVFILQCTMPEAAEFFLLHYGSFNPISWFSSICMHADAGHLIGNMFGLALFGWIIEGKVGWWKFLLIFFAIGSSACAVEQTIMLFSSGGASLGASGVVFGLIAMAMIWAPENDIFIYYGIVVFFRPFAGRFDVSILTLGFFQIAWQFLIASFTGFEMSSAVLHLMGAVPGFAIAVLMLKFRRVDCDGFDMVSLWSGKRGVKTITVEEEVRRKKVKKQRKAERKETLELGLEKVEQYVAGGHYDMALKRFMMLRKIKPSMVMTERQLVKIIKGYDRNPETKAKSIPVIETYLKHYETYKTPFALMLARSQVLVDHRPRKGLETLKMLTWGDLNPKQQDFVRKLIEKAKAMIANGVLEVD